MVSLAGKNSNAAAIRHLNKKIKIRGELRYVSYLVTDTAVGQWVPREHNLEMCGMFHRDCGTRNVKHSEFVGESYTTLLHPA